MKKLPVHCSLTRKHWLRVRYSGWETFTGISLQPPPWRREEEGFSTGVVLAGGAEDRRRHTETKRERCSVCGQGSWCNWCNGCLSFLLRCHSLMTRPSSSGSLWQNTGTRSAGRRLSDSAAVADAFHPPMRPSPQSPLSFPLSFLVFLFVWHLVVPWVYPASSIIDVGPFNTGQHSLFICR